MTKTIPLTQGLFAIVDAEEYGALSTHRWRTLRDPYGTPYAARTIRRNGEQVVIRMHRVILGLPPGKHSDAVVDHINHDTLDNRRGNLRICTQEENNANRRGHSPFAKGVYRNNSKRNPFRSMIMIRGRHYNLGSYPTISAAGAAYAHAARFQYGEFACMANNGKVG